MARAASSYANEKIRVKRQWCKGCGICTALCEHNVLILDNSGKAVIADPAACIGCGKCESHCPDLAITVDRSQKDRVAVYAGKTHQPGYSAEHRI